LEGDTLVVDVTNFTHESNYRGSRENLHLIERYKRVDPKTLQVKITAEDPTIWVRPFTYVTDLRKNPDKPNMVYEGGCQERNGIFLLDRCPPLCSREPSLSRGNRRLIWARARLRH